MTCIEDLRGREEGPALGVSGTSELLEGSMGGGGGGGGGASFS